MEIPVVISQKQFAELTSALAAIQTQNTVILAELAEVRKENADLKTNLNWQNEQIKWLQEYVNYIHINTKNTVEMLEPIFKKFKRENFR